MKILVPVKRVADPDNANKVKVTADASGVSSEGLEWKPNPFDEYAVEAALRLNENAPKNEKLGETIVVSLGPTDVQQTLRQASRLARKQGKPTVAQRAETLVRQVASPLLRLTLSMAQLYEEEGVDPADLFG